MSLARRNVEIAREYLHAIEAGETGEKMARFFDPGVVVEEFPNRLQLLEDAERGQRIVAGQQYEIQSETETGDRLALEVTWLGTLKTAFQNLLPGTKLRARFALFLEFRDGRIVAQRNYDCFDPW